MSKAANMRVSMKATLSSKRCTGVPSRAMTRVQGRSARLVLRASVGETAEENAARLMRESKAVDERTVSIRTRDELEAFLADAEDKLVMLNVESELECDLGDNPEGWAADSQESLAACVRLKHDLARVACECPDVVFLNLDLLPGDDQAAALSKELGVARYPTQQYYKNGQLVWEHVGAGPETMQSMGEGVLYYGGQGAGGVQTNEWIEEVDSERLLEEFLGACALPQVNDRGVRLEVPCDKQLAVLNVSLENNAPECMRIFPAVLSLAKNTAGATRWARLMGDASPQAKALMEKLGVTKAPTFIFYADGKEVSRYSGSDRMGLVNQVLDFQQKNGFKMPQAPPRKRMSTAEAKAIARAKRDAEKARRTEKLF